MAALKHKQPSFNASLAEARKKQAAATVDADNWRDQRPNWAFSKCDLQGCQWSWEHVNGATLVQILQRLKGHETLPWKQILDEKDGHGRRMNGSIEVAHPKIDSEAKKRLEELGLGNFDTVWKLRVDGPGRVWGVRIERTLHIVWWDPEHLVYPLD